MKRHWTTLAALAFGAFPLAAPAMAQTEGASPAEQLFGDRMRAGVRLDALLETWEHAFYKLDTGDRALTAADIDVRRRIFEANARATVATLAMKMDFNGDGTVTEAEMDRVLSYETRSLGANPNFDVPAHKAREKAKWLDLDANQDGAIDWREALTLWDVTRGEPSETKSERELSTAFGLDADGDGRVTLAEYTGAGEALFRRVDGDGSGQLSDDEAAAYQETR